MTDIINPSAVPCKTLSNGVKIPAVGMGTFGSDRYSGEQIAEAVKGGIEVGYRLFDCASVYGNEDKIGASLSSALSSGAVKREQLFVMSKVWNDRHDDVVNSCKDSMRDLGLDYLDAYFIHWPVPNYHAPGCDVSSRSPDAKPYSHEHFMYVWEQMETLCGAGLVRCPGVSNMTVSKLAPVLKEARIKPVLCEMELHPSFQQRPFFDFCLKNGVQPVGYCPVGSPNRPDRDKAPDDVPDLELPVIKEIAAAHGCHPAVIALKWAYRNGQIPIPFSCTRANYSANLRAAVEDPLTDDEYAAINVLDAGSRFIKGQVFLWQGEDDWRRLWD